MPHPNATLGRDPRLTPRLKGSCAGPRARCPPPPPRWGDPPPGPVHEPLFSARRHPAAARPPGAGGSTPKDVRMRPADTIDHPPGTTPWSESDLVELTIRLANRPAAELVAEPGTQATPPSPRLTPASTQPTPAAAGPLAGRVTHPGGGVLRPSTAPAERGEGVPRPVMVPAPAAWSVPLLVTPDVEAWLLGWPAGRVTPPPHVAAWLLGWPAGLVTPAHDHGGATVAVTVIEGGLSEECLDPTIWTTGRRTPSRAGASTLFPAGHVHLLGAAGDTAARAAARPCRRPACVCSRWSGRRTEPGWCRWCRARRGWPGSWR